MIKNSLEFIKKLQYMSNYRGCKESEIIFGRFSDRYLSKLEDLDLQDYETLLNYPDSNLMDWFMFKKDTPDEIKNNRVYELVLECLDNKN